MIILKKVAQKAAPLGVYQRKMVKNVYQSFGLFIIAALNISLIGSDVTRLMAHTVSDWRGELITYAFVVFCDLVIFLPTLLQVKRIRLFDEEMVVETLLWKSRIKWPDIVKFSKTGNMSVAVLKTKHFLYLVNSRDLDGFDDLVAKVKEKLA